VRSRDEIYTIGVHIEVVKSGVVSGGRCAGATCDIYAAIDEYVAIGIGVIYYEISRTNCDCAYSDTIEGSVNANVYGTIRTDIVS